MEDNFSNIKLFLSIFFITISLASYTQVNVDSTNYSLKNGISKPSILSTNTFGIFFSRLNHNFKLKPSKKTEIDIVLESGNVWGANVKTYLPDSETIRNKLRTVNWYSRQFLFDEDTLKGKNYSIKTDGTIKGLRANVTLPIHNQQELVLGFRSFILTEGKFPLSIFTNDAFIEFFHNNIAGGNDPFDRKVFGYNRAEVNYTDRNGNNLKLNKGSFVFGGIEAHYFYYPKLLNNRNVFINFGAHLGTNLSQYNSSIDLGLSAAAVKKLTLNSTNQFLFGIGLNTIHKNSVEFKKNNIEFGTNNFIASLETDIEYNFTSKGKTNHAFGLAFYLQTSLNNKDEFNYAILVRDESAYNSWQHASKHLYQNNNYWTFMYTFTRKIATSFYLQQDFTVNNNPDIQTGVGIKFGL